MPIKIDIPVTNGVKWYVRQYGKTPKGSWQTRPNGAIVWGMPTSIPEEFGDGSDGDLIIRSGEVVTLDVPEPHISVIEKRYSSILIESGGILRCKDHNAGLVLRCTGDCTIHGNINQSGKSPKTNPNNTYQYPPELVCGKGGKGGGRVAAMPGRPYGGGWGSGGPGGGGISGGTTDKITVAIPDSELFKSGKNGGGGPGTDYNSGSTPFPGRPGASTPGGNGDSGWYRAASGGAGNYGGGVILLYVNGNLILSGSILCTGLRGGNGGKAGTNIRNGRSADGAGGGGGGAFYCLYNGDIENTATINVDGGANGLAGEKPSNGNAGVNGEPGENGTVTIKKYGA